MQINDILCRSYEYHVHSGDQGLANFFTTINKIIAQEANDTLFFAEFRTVFLFSVNFPILGGFRFEILKNQRRDPLVKKNEKK